MLVERGSSDDSLATIEVKFLCDSITPLGWPVVPEVKISDATVIALDAWAGTAPGDTAGSVSSSSNASTRAASALAGEVLAERRCGPATTGRRVLGPDVVGIDRDRQAARRHRRSATRRDSTSARGPEARARLTTSAGDSCVSSGTAAAPASRIAKYEMPHSGRFSLHQHDPVAGARRPARVKHAAPCAARLGELAVGVDHRLGRLVAALRQEPQRRPVAVELDRRLEQLDAAPCRCRPSAACAPNSSSSVGNTHFCRPGKWVSSQ